MEKLENLKKEIEEKEKLVEENSIQEKRHNETLSQFKALKETISKLWDQGLAIVNQKDFPNEIKVNNLDEIKIPEVKIPEFPEIPKFPKEIEIKEPKWFSIKGVIEAIKDLKKTIINKKEIDPVLFTKKQNAIAVKLVTQDGAKFYNAGGGGSSNGVPLDSAGNVKVSVKDMPSITVSASDIEIGAVEIKNATDDTRAKVGANGLEVEIKAGNITGYATDTKQSDGSQKTQIVDSTGTSAKVEARKQTPTGNALNVQIGPGDIISNIPIILDFEHHQNHEGEAFMAQYVDTSLDTSTVKFGLTTGAGAATTGSPHLAIDCDVYNGAVRMDLYAEATFTSGATITPVNRNRNVALPAGIMTIKSGVTSTNGTLIESHFIGVGSKGAASAAGRDEWILKPNTIYRVDLIGLSTGTDAILHFNWYEDLGV